MQKRLVREEGSMEVFEITTDSGSVHEVRMPKSIPLIEVQSAPTENEIIMSKLDFIMMMLIPVEV